MFGTLLKSKLVVFERELVISAFVAVVECAPQRFGNFGGVSGKEPGVEVAKVEVNNVSDDAGGS